MTLPPTEAIFLTCALAKVDRALMNTFPNLGDVQGVLFTPETYILKNSSIFVNFTHDPNSMLDSVSFISFNSLIDAPN